MSCTAGLLCVTYIGLTAVEDHCVVRRDVGLPSMLCPAMCLCQFDRCLRALFVLCVVASSAGCGYTLVGTGLGSQHRITLAVAPFTNQTREPGVESQVTAALRQAILQHHAFTLTSEEASARRLSGTVRRFRFYPVSFDENDNALQYRLEADILIRLTEGSIQSARFEREISAWAEYLVSRAGGVRENVVAREAALFRLAQHFASSCTALLLVTLL